MRRERQARRLRSVLTGRRRNSNRPPVDDGADRDGNNAADLAAIADAADRLGEAHRAVVVLDHPSDGAAEGRLVGGEVVDPVPSGLKLEGVQPLDEKKVVLRCAHASIVMQSTALVKRPC